MKKKSISIIIPALNEEENLEATVTTVCNVAQRRFEEYEILIFNDGSTDSTGEIADKLASRNECVRVIHHHRSHCLGAIYKEGRALAKMNYLILVNGKCDIPEDNLDRIFVLQGKADIIIPYTLNIQERSLFRRTCSKTFVLLLNFLFGLRLKYYNHYILHKRDVINSIDIYTDSYAFQAEALIKLIKAGHTYIEVGVMARFQKGIKTKAFRLNNVVGIFMFIVKMIYKVYFSKVKIFNTSFSQ